jgi:hypothetical protein
MVRRVVDCLNVIGSRPDGWWRDRDGAARRLLAALQRLAAATGADVTLVLDGRPLPDLPEGSHDGVSLLYPERPGVDAADDRIVGLVACDPDPSSIRVVSADRRLWARARELGAGLESPGALLRLLDELPPR